MTPGIERNDARQRYEQDGFVCCPPLIPPALVEQARRQVDAVMRGEYATGIPPGMRWWNPGDSPDVLRRLDGSHQCDPVLLAVVTHPAIGGLLAELTGAREIRLWGTQTIIKPPTPEAGIGGSVGWHQDDQYWRTYLSGEVLTVWIALSHVLPLSGPVSFIRASHAWGARAGGDFYNGDLTGLQGALHQGQEEPWEEVPAILAPGGVSVHHRLTIHGSGPNRSHQPRISMAAHYLTDRAVAVAPPDHPKIQPLSDPQRCPLVFPSPALKAARRLDPTALAPRAP